MYGQRNTDRPQANTSLPPCRVCDGPGCGFNYGVTTCDSCKSFFRRSLERTQPYVCILSSHVGPSTSRRDSCPKCRYDKCVAVGMSNDACKARRYPKLKRSKDLVEVMEPKNAVINDDLSGRNTVTKTVHINESSQTPIYNTFSQGSNDVSIQNETYVHETVSDAFSYNDGIWNFERGKKMSTNDSNVSNKSGHLSYDSFNMHETDKTTTLSSSDYTSYPDSGKSKYFPLTSPIAQPYFRMSYIHAGDSTRTRQELAAGETKHQSICNKQRNSRFLEETQQSTSAITPTHENEKSTRYNWDQNTTQINDKRNKRLIAKDVYAENCLKHTNEYNPCDHADHAIGMDNVVVNNNYKPPTGLHKITVIKSVGLPFDKTHHCYERHFYKGPSFDNSFLKAPTTKESTKTCTSRIAYSNASKRRLESENEKEDIPKKSCAGVQTSMEPKTSKNESVTHACKSAQTSLTKPMFLLCVDPKVSYYIRSVFERFPFKCYEKESLSSILNNCYEINGSPTLILKNCYDLGDSSTDYSLTSQSRSDTDTGNRAPDNIPLQGMQYNTLDLSYEGNEMDELFSYLMDIHQLYFKSEQSLMSDLEIRTAQDTFWGLCQFKEIVHGKMKFVDDDKYYTILETTGIDADKRKELLMSCLHPMEEYTWKKMKFFNSIPGFKHFTLDDKITLIKSCLNDYHCLVMHRGIDTNKQIVIDEETHLAFRLCYSEQLFPKFKATILCELANELKELSLSFEEIVVLKAIVLTNPDADEMLEQPAIVQECHTMYYKCLLNLMRKHHGSQADARFANIVRVLYTSIHNARDIKKNCLGQLMDGILRIVDQDKLPLFKESVAPI